MKRKIVDWRLALTLFVVAILVLCQFIPEKGMAGADCRRSLVNTSADDQTTYFPTFYGFPLTVVDTYTAGCFENRTTHISSWSAEGLLVDILFIGVLGTLPYWFLSLWRRFRRRNVTQADICKNE